MSNWYALNNEGDMVSLGEHEDFDGAASTEVGLAAVWVIDDEGARDWLVSLAVLLGASITFKETT